MELFKFSVFSAHDPRKDKREKKGGHYYRGFSEGTGKERCFILTGLRWHPSLYTVLRVT